VDNFLILGTGRSGTSMVAGMFRHTGHFLGDNYIEPRPANPTGFYEDSAVNWANDCVIQRMWSLSIARRLNWPLQPAAHRDRRALWVARPAVRWFRRLKERDERMMRERFQSQPFCYKDPRFSITLPYWRRWLPTNTRFIVVFRDPLRTARSMAEELANTTSGAVRVSEGWCVNHWLDAYRWILHDARRDRASWLFARFDDVISGKALPALDRFVGVPLTADHIDARISRQERDARLPRRVRHVLARLNAEADHDLLPPEQGIAAPEVTRRPGGGIIGGTAGAGGVVEP
jgi:hypothetical protein